MVTMSIDPGLTGAIALFTDEGHPFLVMDMPVMKVRAGGKKDLDTQIIINLMLEHEVTKIVLEPQQSMPKQGVASTFQTGKNYGILLGILDALAFPYELVHPKTWGKAVGRPVGSGKDWGVQEARRRWPALVDQLLVSKDGRADALLIGASQFDVPLLIEPEPEIETDDQGRPVYDEKGIRLNHDEPKAVELPAW